VTLVFPQELRLTLHLQTFWFLALLNIGLVLGLLGVA
jgi:hypothetical protein